VEEAEAEFVGVWVLVEDRCCPKSRSRTRNGKVARARVEVEAEAEVEAPAEEAVEAPVAQKMEEKEEEAKELKTSAAEAVFAKVKTLESHNEQLLAFITEQGLEPPAKVVN